MSASRLGRLIPSMIGVRSPTISATIFLVHASKLAPRLLDARCKPSPQQNHQKTHDIPMTPGEISSKSMVVEMVPLSSVGSVA